MKAVLTLILTVTFVTSPFFSGSFQGFRPDQLPIPQVNPPIQPAGYAFSIWGVIYLWLVASALFGVIKRRDDADWDRPRLPLILSLAVGTPWIYVATQSALWSVVLIWVMLVTAFAALLRSPAREFWWFAVPLGLYAGWLTAASFVALGTLLAGYGIVLDQLGWAYVGLPIATLAGVAGILWSRKASYGIAITWALIGVAVANAPTQPYVTALAVCGTLCMAQLSYRAMTIAKQAAT